MYLILSGGGDASDSKPLDQLLISKMPADKKLLYIPIAWKSGNFEECRAWFESTFSNLGFTEFEMMTDLTNRSYSDLDKFGGIYIGGGNTYSLLHDLHKTGFETLLLQFIESGRPVYGGSAGAIIFGKSIDTAAFGEDSDENTVGLTNTAGFDMVQGHAIQCHYQNSQDSEIIEFVSKRNIPVIALGERSGVTVANNGITVIGFDPIYLFSSNGKVEYGVGSQLAKL
jgi:dipeptidase E